MPIWIMAGIWGFVADLALLLGATAGYYITISRRIVATIIALSVAATTAVAAGAILAMLADTMIPEAFENAHNFAGLITAVGFLVAFVLTKVTEK